MSSSPALSAIYSERVVATVSLDEQERRWAAVRAGMEANKLDALVLYTNADALGGYVRWLSDLATGGGYPISLVFFLDRPMAAIVHGPQGDDRRIPADNPVLKGVDRLMNTASFLSAEFTQYLDASAVVTALRDAGAQRVGLVGISHMPFPFVSHLYEEFGADRFTNATDWIDRIKAIKSDEEIAAIERTAAMQDDAFAYVLDRIEPGMREMEITALLNDFCTQRGSDAGVLLTGSGPRGDIAHIAPRRLQNRRLEKGDALVLLIERNGVEGLYTELGRTIVLGEAPDDVLEEWEFTVRAQDFCVERLASETPARQLLVEYNEFLRDHGKPEERRLHMHGQGYDIVERPLAHDGEAMTLLPGMNIAAHPDYQHDGMQYWLCDNFLVTGGTARRLHRTPRTIFEVAL